MIDASARQVHEPRLAIRDLTLAIVTFIWTRLPCARYDRLCPMPFGFEALAGSGLGCLRLSGRVGALVCQLT